jgi:hypothetical protein
MTALSPETLAFLKQRLARRANHHKRDLMYAVMVCDVGALYFVYNVIGGQMVSAMGNRPTFNEVVRDLRDTVNLAGAKPKATEAVPS